MSVPALTVPPIKLLCFGFGYTAHALARQIASPTTTIVGTRRHRDCTDRPDVSLAVFDGQSPSPSAIDLLPGTTHILLSIPPGADGDPVLRWHAADLAALPTLRWIGYLSTIGVYGDAAGAWVDETSPASPQSERAHRRVEAEKSWRAFGKTGGKRVEIFRLPGIYGPGRSTIDTLRAGTARRLIKPGQVFNRAHVDDIAAALAAAIVGATSGNVPDFDVFNIVDDEPAPPQDVVAFAANLLGLPLPPEQPYDAALLSPMAQSFYGESKRVNNLRLKKVFAFSFKYPTYREGLRAIVDGI